MESKEEKKLLRLPSHCIPYLFFHPTFFTSLYGGFEKLNFNNQSPFKKVEKEDKEEIVVSTDDEIVENEWLLIYKDCLKETAIVVKK